VEATKEKKMIDEDKPKSAGVYVRVSTDKQEADNQLLQLRKYCSKKGYTIFREYTDVTSGAATNRPAFNEAFKDAHAMAYDVLVFWDISRFSRAGTLYTLQKLRELDNLGVEWDSFQDQYFQSAGAFKDVVISIMATLAKIEREKISERTKAGLERAKLNGRVLGRPKGSKDKKKRSSQPYIGNKNFTKGTRIKGGLENPSFMVSNTDSTDEYNESNKRPIVSCPKCGGIMKGFRYEYRDYMRCKKCEYKEDVTDKKRDK